MTTKKHKTKTSPNPDRDSMRPEYDFSTAERGITAARYAEGTNVAFLDSLLRPLTQDQYDRWQRIEDEHAAKIYAAPERYNGDCPD